MLIVKKRIVIYSFLQNNCTFLNFINRKGRRNFSSPLTARKVVTAHGQEESKEKEEEINSVFWSFHSAWGGVNTSSLASKLE